MSENETAEAAFRLQRIYTKDVSFENPNSPEIFARSSSQPKIEMSLNISNRKVNDDHWEVSMKVGATTRDTETDKLLFEIEVEQAGVFFMQNIPEEHMPMILEVECPTLIFPYTRQVVSQLTVDGGFMPFILEPVNFRALYESKVRQAQEKAQAEAGEQTIQ